MACGLLKTHGVVRHCWLMEIYFFTGNKYVQDFLLISVLQLEIQFSSGEVWDLNNRFYPATLFDFQQETIDLHVCTIDW